MAAKKFAYIGGVIMLLIGLLSLIPGFEGSLTDLPLLKVNLSYGLFLSLFPMNIFNKVALILFGLGGILISKRDENASSINYARTVFFTMGALSLLGLSYSTNTLNGYWPLFGYEALAHGFFALVAGYCGFIASRVKRHSHRQMHA